MRERSRSGLGSRKDSEPVLGTEFVGSQKGIVSDLVLGGGIVVAQVRRGM